MGIDVGETTILVTVKPLLHRRYVFGHSNRMTLEKVWTEHVLASYPLQTIVRDLRVHAPNFVEYTTVEEVFRPLKNIFIISTVYYGSMGTVEDPSTMKNDGRIKSIITQIICQTVEKTLSFFRF